MAEVGQVNTLTVSRITALGAVLDGGSTGDIMLVPDNHSRELAAGDQLDVFVYVDADHSLMATTTVPMVVANQTACLEVVALTPKGAYLNWGLPFDLFMPRSEQLGDMRIGRQCVVYAMLDLNSQRMIATARLHEHLSEFNDQSFDKDQHVNVVVCQKTDLGFRAVIEGSHLGMLYHSEVFTDLQIGDNTQAYIKAVRSDNKIDLVLQKGGRQQMSGLEGEIINHLEQNHGVSTLTDKSPPNAIYQQFGVSKKVYKQALGALYKARRITVSKQQIELVKS